MNIEQELFNLSIKLENIAALTRAVLTNLEMPDDSFAQSDACSLSILLQRQVAEADELLLDIINSYGEKSQSVQVDVTASIVVAADTRRTVV